MAIKLTGEWSITVAGKEAALDQRIVISGSSNGQDGQYLWTDFGTKTIQGEFGLQIQYKKYDGTWHNSLMRVPNVERNNNTVTLTIESDDMVGVGDLDFDDLVLSAETTVDDNDYCIWGQAKGYQGCLFNPCELPRLIIDDWVLAADKLNPRIREVIEPIVTEVPPIAKPPLPDPPPFDHRAIRVEVPSELAQELFAGQTLQLKRGAFRQVGAMQSASPLSETLRASETTPAVAASGHQWEVALAGKYRRFISCQVDPAPGVMLRIIDYDPGPGESPSGPYYGTGHREVLGQVVTDNWGFYFFIFSWSYPHSGGLKPDIILQLTRFDTDGEPYVALESSVSWNIDKIFRKDFCFPSHLIDPVEPEAVDPDRTWQYIGNLPIVRIQTAPPIQRGLANSVAGDGTPAYPLTLVNAPFGGTLLLKANFRDLPVAHYRILYRTSDNPEGDIGWTDLNTPLKYLNATWNWETVGPVTTTIEGTPMDAYPNHEGSYNYSHPHGLQYKGYIKTGFMQVGFLDLQIRGYDSSGSYIPESYDFVSVRIDNVAPLVEIQPIGAGPEACGYVSISQPSDKIPITYRVIDSEGFLRRYYINLFKCHNNLIGGVRQFRTDYSSSMGIHWTGTPDETSLAPDLDGFVTRDLPESGNFFTSTEAATRPNFVAVAIELWASSRTTDGIRNSLHWPRYVEVIGIKLE
jgi:hypothetical protein